MVKNNIKGIALLFGLISSFACQSNINYPVAAAEKLNRNQIMLIDLKSAPESAGFYIVHSYSTSKEVAQNLERALNQLIAVDKAYAKYRNRPDDRFLQATCLKVTLAKQTAQDLEQQLEDAFAELKSNVEETLITDEHFPDSSPNRKKQKNMIQKYMNH